MATPLKDTGEKSSASASTSSPSPRQATSSGPRPLTPSEIEWLRQQGQDFLDNYEEIRARALGKDEDDTLR